MRFALCVLVLGCAPRAAPRETGASPASPKPPGETQAVTAGAPADAGATQALPPGCLRQRQAVQSRCSGAAPREGEPTSFPVTVCDRCLADSDCAEKPGGKCVSVGGQACVGPQRFECRYPSPECGGRICPERPPPMPPSTPPRGQ
jgi:hypothetical protein